MNQLATWALVCVLTACTSSSGDDGNGSGGAGATGGNATTTDPGSTSVGGGNPGAGGAAAGGAGPDQTAVSFGGMSQSTDGLILYGSPYANVNMWYGPVDFTESVYHNGCGQSEGSKYPTVIQNLYGNYLIGLDGENIANVESQCDNCAQLTVNGKTLIAHVITFGIENGVHAIDLNPELQTALGLSSSAWTGTWQFSSCPTGNTPIYYEFDRRQWSDMNFWYMRIWTRNQKLPVTALETKVGSGAWTAASRQGDGAWQTVAGVDFSGGFQVRVTAVDSQQLTDTIPAPTGINPANPVAGATNFK